MDIRQYLSLRNKQRTEQLSADEGNALQQWSQSAEGNTWLQDLQEIERLSDRYKSTYEPDVEAGLLRLQARIQQAKLEDTPLTPTLRVVTRRTWINIAAAAAIFIIGLVAFRAWMQPQVKTIAIETRAAERKAVLLSDGTNVQLNDRTTLSSPETFKNQAKRKVVLEGEAYFEVKPDSTQPFEIAADELTIVVLGTAFNVRAYPTESTTEIEVTHGAVRVSINNKELVLKANQKGIYDRKTGELYPRSAPLLNANAWRTHRLQFQGTRLAEVLQELERYYKVKIELDSKMANCLFTGDFRKTPLKEVLETLQVGLNVQFIPLSPKKYKVQGILCQ